MLQLLKTISKFGCVTWKIQEAKHVWYDEASKSCSQGLVLERMELVEIEMTQYAYA